MYRPYDKAAFDKLMAEGNAKLEASRNADPAIASAQRAYERAQEHLANEQHIQRNLSNDPKWRYWTKDQQFSVIMQMDERVAQAQDAVNAADKAIREAESAHWQKAQQSQLDAQNAERKKQEDEAQKQYSEQEKGKYREEARKLYLAAGGTETDFEKAFPAMWEQKLIERTQSGRDDMVERMRARYAGIHI